jgi:hypothetical protein
VRSYFRYRAAAVEIVAKEIDRELRAKPQQTKYEIQLAEMVSRFEPRVAFDSFVRAFDKPRGEIAYEMLSIALKAGQSITREMIERCDGPWRMLAMAALGRRHLIAGRPSVAQRWRDRMRRALVKMNTPIDHRAAFELAQFDRLEAIRRCDMTAAREATERMTWHARSNSALAGLAMVVEVEQACDDGDLRRATRVIERLASFNACSRDFIVMGRTAHAQALLALLQGRYDQAWDLARLAATALSEVEPGFSICAHVNVGRAALQLEKTWSPPLALSSRFPGSWITGMIHAVHCRHLAATDAAAATQTAENAIRIATTQEAPGMLCYAQASMAFAAEQAQRPDEAQALRVDAWEMAVRLARQSYLHDIFAHPAVRARQFGAFDLDNAFIEAIARRAKEICIAQVGSCLPAQVDLIRPLVKATLATVTLGKAPTAVARTVALPDRASLAEFLAPRLAKDLAICLNFEDRETFLAKFIGTMCLLGASNAGLAVTNLIAAS